jgi:histidinol-phosphate aminotransferase
MSAKHAVSRRGFVGGGFATAVGYLGLQPNDVWAKELAPVRRFTRRELEQQQQQQSPDYDSMAKLGNNENPYGPPEAVMKAMNSAWKYSNRYGYPDGGLTSEIAKHHGLKNENVMTTAGSSEVLEVVGTTFLQGGKKVVGVDPTYGTVYQYASGIKADAIRLPLTSDFTQDTQAMIRATIRNYRNVGLVYVCNPNNPTGRVIPASEIKQLLDAIPEDMVVLIDEAYHHYVEDPQYATSVPYILEGRNVIVARTFSKIYGMAGMRLGYALAPKHLIDAMDTWGTGSVNALVKHGGVAALKDTESPARIKKIAVDLRKKTTAELQEMGYPCIPSETNFFMVHIKTPVQPVIQEFRKRSVIVGRPFPPMTEYLRVSVCAPEEMDRFMVAFKQIFTPQANGTKNG